MENKNIEKTTKFTFEGFIIFLKIPLTDRASIKEHLRISKIDKMHVLSLKEKRKCNKI